MPINYDPNINLTAGTFVISQGSKPVSSADGNTLLNLLFWLTYTAEGRQFIKDNRLGGQFTEDQIRSNFAAKLAQNFGLTDEGLLGAITNAHLAADRYITARASLSRTDMDTQDKVYQQNLSFIMWTLWENALAHEFSMNW